LSNIDDVVSAARSVLTRDINLQALDYWNERRGDRMMPARADLDPADLDHVLANIVLLDVRAEPLDFRYRLIGTAVMDHQNGNLAGQWMRDIPHQAPPSKIYGACRRAVEERCPVSDKAPHLVAEEKIFSAETVVMPLSVDGKTVNMLFLTVEYWNTDSYQSSPRRDH
jgi:hypothetical protein